MPLCMGTIREPTFTTRSHRGECMAFEIESVSLAFLDMRTVAPSQLGATGTQVAQTQTGLGLMDRDTLGLWLPTAGDQVFFGLLT